MHIISFILLLLLLCTPIKAKEPVVVALTHIPKVLEFGRANNPYNRLVEVLQAEITIPVSYDFMPSERGNRLLAVGKVDCIFPIIPANYKRAEKTSFSKPINGISLNLFALDRKYKGLAELDGQIVVHLRGYLFANAKDKFPNIKFFPAASHGNAINMLKNGRASAYLDYMPDVKFSVSAEQMAQLRYDKENPVLQANDSFECKDTGAPKAFLKQVERIIKNLRSEDKLKKVLGSYYVPVR